MKIAAIYNVFDGVELLRGSMMCLKDDVDIFIIVYQQVSNYGELYYPLPDMDLAGFNYLLVKYNTVALGGSLNEKSKRNIGIDYARQQGCTHFMHVDCDEYYEDFHSAVGEYLERNENGGSVCKMFTYFKEPTLRFENPDNYYVPFIHKLKPNTIAGVREYPFYADPTRRINEENVIEMSIKMHHFSWVRKDIGLKVRNSSAKSNIERSQLLLDYHSPEVKSGFYSSDFRQKLIEVDNKFNIKL